MSLEQKFDLYLREFRRHQDSNGFILTRACDSLLFSCLAGCVEGVHVDAGMAEDAPGQWFRRPLDSGYPECYECGASKSTISRDMLLGLAWYAWCNKRLDISEGVIKYAFKNFGVMGKGVLSRTFIGPGLLATFAWISYKLGGPSRPWLRGIPVDLGAKNGIVDYRAHLQVLHCHLRAEVTKRKEDVVRAADVANHHVERIGSVNAYFNYVGTLDTPIYRELDSHILALMPQFPDGSLPNNWDYSTEWLWERDPGKDWEPDEHVLREHTGGDFLWAAAWYLGKIKNVNSGNK